MPHFHLSKTSAILLGLLLLGCNVSTDLDDDTSGDTGGDFTGAFNLADTMQASCYDNAVAITCPSSGDFYGQAAQYSGNPQTYSDMEDGTVVDNVTGIMWTKGPDTSGDGEINVLDKLSSTDAAAYCDSLELAGYNDWQLPSIKQMYSLMNFQGTDPSSNDQANLVPFIDTEYFNFAYGDEANGERIIDAQYATTSRYVSDENSDMLFGVNFADGRIKGYEESFHGSDKTYFVMCMRGNTDYGNNEFDNNLDGTVTDLATGLMWAQDDSGADYLQGFDYGNNLDWSQDTNPIVDTDEMNGAMSWQDALAYVQQKNDEAHLGYSNWRLPNAIELQSLLDYASSPYTHGTAAIDPIFNATVITSENFEDDYAFYWTSNTHARSDVLGDSYGSAAAYVSFGRSLGYDERTGQWIDVHGAGAQRSDPKAWDGSDYSHGHGPQGDAIRIYNYVRLVRDAG